MTSRSSGADDCGNTRLSGSLVIFVDENGEGPRVGFGLVVLGVAMIAVAALRFFRTAKQIASDVDEPAPGVRFDLTLATLLVLLGWWPLLYLPHVIHSV
jgi:uncharacterized membrane protein YidH (DUF202 family)